MSDPDMGSWSYVYDALGNLTSQIDARRCVTSLVYDALNRLLGKTYSNASGGSCSAIAASTSPVSYTYDQGTNGKGRRTGMADGSGSTSWQYDGPGRMTVETVSINGIGTYTTKWGYDSADHLAATVYPSGETVYTTYNAQGLAISLDSTRLTSYASQVKYDEAGRLLEWTLGNGVKTSRLYYPWNTQGGRLQSIASVILSSGVPRQNLVYGYDANGNVASVQDTVAGESLTYNTDRRAPYRAKSNSEMAKRRGFRYISESKREKRRS
jgi:YD repeat-containing protein